MKYLFTVLKIMLIVACLIMSWQVEGQTYCNPLNISYRFCLDQPSRREAADPTVVVFKDTYYLFASKSGGYWYSNDLLTWIFVTVTANTLPIENYAPTATVIGDWVYFMTSGSNIIYRSSDPKTGMWEVYNSKFPYSTTDPALFTDTDGRVYLYHGCSNNAPILAVELDVNNKLNPIGNPVTCFSGNPIEHGWEQPGDYNLNTGNPWIEGSWMNKYNGKYYLQYAGPGAEFKSYADGVYVSDKPLGPFTYAVNNPFSSKPEGFIAGAGHGSTFVDKYGNWWHIATMNISVKHMFERRLGLFPAGFDQEGNLFTVTDFGDYPLSMPNHKYDDVSGLFPGWMLLSYKKSAEVSSGIDTYPVTNAFDENIRTYWSAQTGNTGEWLLVDLDSLCTIHAVQINFAENNTFLYGRTNILSQQYLVEYSTDKQNWEVLIDKTANAEDLSHPFETMATPVKARFVKITNHRVPGGTFAISDFRIFGTGSGLKTAKVVSVKMQKYPDSRILKVIWGKKPGATGYNIRFGTQNNKLFRSYQLYGDTSVMIRSLNKDQLYYFEIDAFNENGVVSGDIRVLIIRTQPLNKSVYVGSLVQFKTESYNPIASFQWQENAGNGYMNLSDTGSYSGAATHYLTIRNVQLSQDGNRYRCIVEDGNISDTTKVVSLIVNTTGIHDLDNEKDYVVFPNPSKDVITIQTGTAYTGFTYFIFDEKGKQVLAGKLIMPNTVVDISRLAVGLYFVQVGELGKKTFKVLKH